MKKQKNKKQQGWTRRPDSDSSSHDLNYRRGCRLATAGRTNEARSLYEELQKREVGARLKALICNDLAALAAQAGNIEAAEQGFRTAIEIDPQCGVARGNLTILQEDHRFGVESPRQAQEGEVGASAEPGRVKVAILSFLFNWPSTGGGIVHTVELIQFLAKAGYEVRHFYARHPAWGVGNVEGALSFDSEALDFEDSAWNIREIQTRFRRAVDAFAPDHIIITDSWNIKPILAQAVQTYPYILRFQAMECLCPLNNVRLLQDGDGRFRQCDQHQLANPEICSQCLQQRGHHSGSLHRAERALSGVGTPQYHETLIRSLREAHAVLVVNPLQEAMMRPYTDCVRVVTSGMDPARFPWPWPCEPDKDSPGKMVVFFGGLVEETLKGFPVLHEACRRLWQKRQDFGLVATGDPAGQIDDFTRFIGWQSQQELPRHLRAADMLAMPTIAQEALGRTAVEAMGVGRPVVASRLGGLPFTVADGATGLLCKPGDAEDLARKIETLLDNPDLRRRLGEAGRRRFDEHYSWPVIIERHYKCLLSPSAAMTRPSTSHPFIPLLREGREGAHPYPSPLQQR